MRRLCVFCGSNAGHDPAYRAVAEELGFVSPEHRAMLLEASSPEDLPARFLAYPPPEIPKWITQAET